MILPLPNNLELTSASDIILQVRVPFPRMQFEKLSLLDVNVLSYIKLKCRHATIIKLTEIFGTGVTQIFDAK